MIRFLGKTEEGDERVAVADYSRERKGELEFTFRPIEDGEPIQWYFDKIMNTYWWETGKNKRRWQDE